MTPKMDVPLLSHQFLGMGESTLKWMSQGHRREAKEKHRDRILHGFDAQKQSSKIILIAEALYLPSINWLTT